MNQPIFNNFDIHISVAQTDNSEIGIYNLSVQQSLGGETSYPIEIHIDLKNVVIQDALTDLNNRTINAQRLIDFGTQLTKWLLPPGPVRNLYQRSLGIAEAQGQGLRLRLRIDPPELSAWPWEYMYDESSQEFFVLNSKTTLIRYHNQPISPVTMVRKIPISILIIMAEPIEVNALTNSTSELSNLLQALKPLREQGNIGVDILYGGISRQTIQERVQREKGVHLLSEALSIDTMRNTLRRNAYHIIHYIGHSMFDDELGGVLLLTDDHNQVAMIDARRLAQDMRGASASVIVLNACQSGRDDNVQSFMGLAPRLIQAGVPAVVAMQYDIPDQAAMRFSSALYQSLADQQPLDAAIVDGRKALSPLTSSEFSMDWGVPVLFMRSHNGMLWGQDILNDEVQTSLQKVSRQTEHSNLEEQPSTLAQGIHRYVGSLLEQSRQASIGGPYRGLLTYRLGDAEIFFGRGRDMDQLLSHLHRNPLTILHAESGAGKSSLLQAGLAPHLIAEGHLPILLRPYNLSPTLALKRFLVTNLASEPILLAESLRDFLYRVHNLLDSQTKLYIFLDQFEEFFIFLDETTQAEFIHELAECLEDRTLDVCWLLALRGEYFGNLANFRPRIANPFTNDHRLNRMDENTAYRVIDKPADHYGLLFENGLIQRLIDDLNQTTKNTTQLNSEFEEGVVPSQLQLVCLALYEELGSGQNVIKHILYEKLGGVAGILQNHLARVLRRGLPANQRGTARFLLEALITSQTRRIIRTRTELITELSHQGVDDITIDQVLHHMVEARLLHVIDSHDEIEPVYELAHDYLIEQIELSSEVRSRKEAQELLEREIINWRLFGTSIGTRALEIIYREYTSLYVDDVAAELLIRSSLETDLELDTWLQIAPSELACTILLDSLTHPKVDIRVRSIVHLVNYYNEQVEKILVDIIKNDANMPVHKAALNTLASCDSLSARQIALEDIQHADPSIRSHAVGILKKLYIPDDSLEGGVPTDSEKLRIQTHPHLEIRQALFASVNTDDDLSTWTQALEALNAQFTEITDSQSNSLTKEGVIHYTRRVVSKLFEKSTVEYWHPLLQGSYARQSAIHREVISNQAVELPVPIKCTLLWSHIRHIILTKIRSSPVLTSFFLLFMMILLFIVSSQLYSEWLDAKWIRYSGETATEELRTITIVEDQILIGTYEHGLAWFRDGDWKTNFLEGFPTCPPAFDGQYVFASKCTIFTIAHSNQKLPEEQFYVLVKDGIYRYENKNWTPIRLPEIEGRYVRPGHPICLTGVDLDLVICEPLAIYNDRLLLLTEEDIGIWASYDKGETWENLQEQNSFLERKFSVVLFDKAGVPYIGGESGLYRGSGNPWKWENVEIGSQTITNTPAIKHMAIGSFHSERRLYLNTVIEDSEGGDKIQQIGCYTEDGDSISGPYPLPITNPLSRLGGSIGIRAIEPHPQQPDIFYISDDFGAVYEMNCHGKHHRIAQKPHREGSVGGLAVWEDSKTKEFYLFWANYSGLYQYTIPLSQGAR